MIVGEAQQLHDHANYARHTGRQAFRPRRRARRSRSPQVMAKPVLQDAVYPSLVTYGRRPTEELQRGLPPMPARAGFTRCGRSSGRRRPLVASVLSSTRPLLRPSVGGVGRSRCARSGLPRPLRGLQRQYIGLDRARRSQSCPRPGVAKPLRRARQDRAPTPLRHRLDGDHLVRKPPLARYDQSACI